MRKPAKTKSRQEIIYGAIRSRRGMALLHDIAASENNPAREEYQLKELVAYIDIFLAEEVRRRNQKGQTD